MKMASVRALVVPILLLAPALLMSACGPNAAGGEIQAWIDAPLDQSALPLAPVEIVAHAAHLGGIAQVEFLVEDATIASQQPENDQATIVTQRHTWDPPSPGEYRLWVRAQGNGASWVESEPVTVRIAIEPTGTPSPTASNTATSTPTGVPTATSTPTSTASATYTASPVPPTRTNTPSPIPDNQPPSVSVGHSPASVTEQMAITFTANASDNVGVARIEIWVGPPGQSLQHAKTCTNTTTCVLQGGPYSAGQLSYDGRAWDAAGNMNATWTMYVNVQAVPH